jgi:hypothetical protein
MTLMLLMLAVAPSKTFWHYRHGNIPSVCMQINEYLLEVASSIHMLRSEVATNIFTPAFQHCVNQLTAPGASSGHMYRYEYTLSDIVKLTTRLENGRFSSNACKTLR